MSADSPAPDDADADSATPGVTREAVLAALDGVTDPELDESVVELEYVQSVEVALPRIRVAFRLPTAWCSPAFAWMMASDMRAACESLDGCERARVRLTDHLHGEEITEGVNAGRAFEDVFEDATEGVEAVREVLDGKARLKRQYDAAEALLDSGCDPEQLATLRRGDVTPTGDGRVAVCLDGLAVFADGEPVEHYIEKAVEVGVATDPDHRLFATPEGTDIDPDAFELVHRRARLAKTNMSGQGAVCDGLRRSRYGEDDGGEGLTGD
ncbi:iron-sulfur cluster assembly protein [Halomarina litorea]|uniref:iron-sulfur cluster assembly protein n=1 Tax=Halomarina litorea TaxID=2961595 RepID=UPI0020C47263|nr:iron-sulfur cluster assembly protein [Halomarina sp. BCD28]